MIFRQIQGIRNRRCSMDIWMNFLIAAVFIVYLLPVGYFFAVKMSSLLDITEEEPDDPTSCE